MSRQKYLISGIEWRKKDGDFPSVAVLDLPGYVYLDTPTNRWGPWIREELSTRYDGKAKRFESCAIINDDILKIVVVI